MNIKKIIFAVLSMMVLVPINSFAEEKVGSSFFKLKSDENAYISKAYSGISYYYPTVSRDSSEAIKLKFKVHGSHDGLVYGQTVSIITTDSFKSGWGSYNLLGAFTDPNCYYWKEYGKNTEWEIIRASDSSVGGPVRYGDRILLRNLKYKNQYLTRNAFTPGSTHFLTTRKRSKDFYAAWQILRP